MRLPVAFLLFCNVLAIPLDTDSLLHNASYPLGKRDFDRIVCFKEDDEPRRTNYKIKRGDCDKLPDILATGDKSKAPMTFSTDKEKGYVVPYFIQFGTCLVGVASTEGEDDIFTMDELGELLVEVIVACVTRMGAQMLGGGQPAGYEGHLSAIVIGARDDNSDAHDDYWLEVVQQRTGRG